jgi:AraC family transcriptional regulator, transcriptional activator of pobA
MPSKTLPRLPFSRPDQHTLELELIAVSAQQPPVGPIHHHRHEFYEIIFVTDQTATHTVDFQTYTLEPGDVLIIPRNSVHNVPNPTPYGGLWLLFTDAFLLPEQSRQLATMALFNPLIDNKHLALPPDAQPYIDLLHHEYRHQAQVRQGAGPGLLQHLLFALLLKLDALALTYPATPAQAGQQAVYLHFMALLEVEFRQHRPVTYVADVLRTTPKRLNAALMAQTGQTASELLTDRLVLEAKRLLTYTSLSVKEVAYELGFEDSHYFSRLFKKQVRLSPELFRSSNA